MTQDKRHRNDDNHQILPDPIKLCYQPAFFCRYMYSDTKDANCADRMLVQDAAINPSIELWIRHPAELSHDPCGAFTLDLKNTPTACAKGQIAAIDIEVDDHTNDGGYTAFGPFFPHAYSSGGVYISYDALKRASDRDRDACNKHCVPYLHAEPLHDETILVSSDPESDSEYGLTRYHGFFGYPIGSPDYPQLWIVWHSGSLKSTTPAIHPGEHLTPPKKLWLPDGSLYAYPDKPCLQKGNSIEHSYRDVTNEIYLEQLYATHEAKLVIPKQPSAAGQETRNNDSSQLVPRIPNFNLVSKYTPGEMHFIKQKLGNNYWEVAEDETLVEALSRYVTCMKRDKIPIPQFSSLDIIGHSRAGDRVLKLGELALTSRTAKEQFKKVRDAGILDELNVEQIRLLGCRTATPTRGRHVVQTILDVTELEVCATRSDLFAVHFNEEGLHPRAKSLLADSDVITYSGPGDLPPTEDYPATPPDDDDDDDDDSEYIAPDVPPPARLSLATLSDVNAASVSAKNYLLWKGWQDSQFSDLVALVYADQPRRDNRLKRADCEVLLAVAEPPQDISDFRSFDLLRCDKTLRLRVNYDGISYCFFFRDPAAEALRKLCECGIHLERLLM